MFTLRLQLLVVTCLSAASAATQSAATWDRDSLGIAHGLSDNNVMSIHRDRRGFVWIGTQNGLNRWDGYDIRTFNYNPSDTNSLSANSIHTIVEDLKGRLWIGTLGAGLCRFDPRTERFERFSKSDRPDGLHDNSVMSALADQDGVLWLGTINGLSRFDPEQRTFKAYKPVEPRPAVFRGRFPGPPSGHITAIVAAADHTLWVGTAFGLCRFDKRTGLFDWFLHNPADPGSIPHPFIFNLYRSPTGDLWVQCPKGWVRFDPARQIFTPEKILPGIPPQAAKSRLWQHADGSIWEATDQGARHWTPRQNPFELGLRTRYPAEVFAFKKIRALRECGGYLWIASQEGLFRSRVGGGQPVFERVLPDDVHAIWSDEQTLWAAVKNNGLFRIMASTAAREYFSFNNTEVSGRFLAITRDNRGRIWLGGARYLYYFDPATGAFAQPSWVGAKQPNHILSLLMDRQQRLWIGTLSEGLFVLSFDAKGQVSEIENFRYDARNATSLSNDIVLAIWQGDAGDLWFGTDGGLNGLDKIWQPGQPAQFRRYLRSDGLADNKIMSLLDDREGNLWVAHLSHGISCLKADRKTVRTYGVADGLPSSLCYWTSAWRRPDGALLFGTTEGLAAFHPDSLQTRRAAAPPVYCTDIQLFHQSLSIGPGREMLPESPIFAPPLVFSHTQNSLTFQFAALNLAKPGQNRYAYRLEPLDAEWRDLGTRREVSFSNLSPGWYTLRVKAGIGGETWADDGAVLSFRILPPWWRSTAAYIIYALALLAALFRILQIQVRLGKQRLWKHVAPGLTAAETPAQPSVPSGPELEFLQQLHQVLERYFSDEYFSVEEMARHMAMSRTQLHRKAVELTGFSAGQLLQTARLRHATELLAQSDKTIAEIAFACGFSDPNYFSRLFSKTQGMTPTAYIQRVKSAV